MSTSKHLPSRLPTLYGLVEVVDGVVPSSRPIYSGADDSSGLIAGMQLRYTFQTTGTDGTETVTYSVTRGGAETASGSLVLNGAQSCDLSAYQYR